MNDMVTVAVNQMQDSSLFDHKFLQDWKTQEDHLGTWEAMKLYYGRKFTTIKTCGGTTIKSFNTINSVTESDNISQYFKDFSCDALINTKQINLMQTSFKGTMDTMNETMLRLKTALTL